VKTKKPRLYGKKPPRMPKPVSAKKDKDGFSLRLIDQADHRFAVVKQMKARVDQLLDEAGCETFAKQCLAGRAVFILSYLESTELDALEGKQIDWKMYFQSVRSLGDVLAKIGLDKEAKQTIQLSQYIESSKKIKSGKQREHSQGDKR
jgi:hypothetical protein